MEHKVIYPANISELGRMGVDLYFNKIQNFSKEDANKAFRESIIEIVGARPEDKGFFYKWQDNKQKVFNLISETITTILPVTIDMELGAFADIQSVNWGDQLVFDITDPKMFDVSVVADGTNNFRRQRLDNGKLKLAPKNREITIYEEFYRWISGRIDWAVMVDRVSRSFLNKIRTDIYGAIYDAYNSLNSAYAYTGSFTDQQYVTLAQHVEAGTGGLKPMVVGSKLALSKVMNGQYFYSGALAEEFNRTGYLANYLGYPLLEIKQSHTPNTDNFAIDNNSLFFIPTGAEKIVKIGFEGDTRITEKNVDQNADESVEYTFKQRYDVQILSAGKFGIYKFA